MLNSQELSPSISNELKEARSVIMFMCAAFEQVKDETPWNKKAFDKAIEFLNDTSPQQS